MPSDKGTCFAAPISSTLTAYLTDPSGNLIAAGCVGVPPVTANLFAIGCLMIRSTGAVYANTGTVAAPVWTQMGTVAALANGAIFVGDAGGAAQACVPAGDVTITNAGVTAIGADKVAAAMLKAAVAALIQGTPTITPGAEAGGDTIDVAIQLTDAQGTNLAAKHGVHIWLSDAAAGALCAVAPSGAVTVTTGVKLSEDTAKTEFGAVSDATGAIVVRIIEAAAKTLFVNVEYQGKVTSGEVSFAA